jgi:outer membrane biosynthesis protein TonB
MPAITAVLALGLAGGLGWWFWQHAHAPLDSSVSVKPPVQQSPPAVDNQLEPAAKAKEEAPAVAPPAAVSEPKQEVAVVQRPSRIPPAPAPKKVAPVRGPEPAVTAPVPANAPVPPTEAPLPKPASIPAPIANPVPVPTPAPAAIPTPDPPPAPPAIPSLLSAKDNGPSAGILTYTGEPVVQNGEIVFDGLPPAQLHLAYDANAWDARLEKTNRNTQRLILRNKKPGRQKRCVVRWDIVQ